MPVTKPPQHWNVYAADQNVDFGGPHGEKLLATLFGTREQVVSFALRKYQSFRAPYGGDHGRVEPADVTDVSNEVPLQQASIHARNLIEEFELAAALAYWEADQGTAAATRAAEKDRMEKKAKLLDYILELETKVSK